MRAFATWVTPLASHRLRILALVVLCFGVPFGQAQDAAEMLKLPKTESSTKVTAAYRAGPNQAKTVSIGDELVVEVENLGALRAQGNSTSPPKKIVLFLDGREIKGVVPSPPTDPDTSSLTFPLQRPDGSKDAWAHILGKPRWLPRSTSVSIGLADGYPVESVASVDLQVIREGWFYVWLLVFCSLVILFLSLALKSDLLRDSGPNPTTGRRPYSLSRTQAAWWFFIVLASYLFIGMVTGDYATTITGTVLVLIGISAGTVVASAVIDAGKEKPPVVARKVAAAALATIRQRATEALAPAQNTIEQKNAALTAVAQSVTATLEAPAPEVPANQFWWKDILSDADGVSFHRFQNAAWTLVLGIIFIAQVYEVLAMPTFGDTLLALMGISGGTYVGMKVSEPPGKPKTQA